MDPSMKEVKLNQLIIAQQYIKVAVRCRPLSKRQIQNKNESIIDIKPQIGEIVVHNRKNIKQNERVFTFDRIFQPSCQQEQLFRQAALPIIDSVFEGYNGTIFAYGQTGAGKTHTMQGQNQYQNLKGIIPRTFQHIIQVINQTPDTQFIVKVSMLQIYNQKIVDLLSQQQGNKLLIHQNKEKGIYVKDLKSQIVNTVSDMNKKLLIGSKKRCIGQTLMSRSSSRSHSIFIINIEQEIIINGQSKLKVGKLNLVDLAGSQKLIKTKATGIRSTEGIYINLSLSSLCQVIKALANSNSTHIPYRDSTLTRLLQQSLGGNSKTIMIANIGPSNYNYEETINTLRYASEVKKIKNKPKINQNLKDAMIRQYEAEIEKLKKILEAQMLKGDSISIAEKVKKQFKNTIYNKNQKEHQQIEKKNYILGQQQQIRKQLIKKKQIADQKKEQERIKHDQLALKLKEMMGKLLNSDKLKQQARIHDKKISEAQKQLKKTQLQEKKLQEQLDQIDKDLDNIVSKNLTLKQQVEHQRILIAKINKKLKLSNEANNDLQDFIVQDRENLEEQNRLIASQLKLANIIIENFVPLKQIVILQERLVFDEILDDWIIVQKYKNQKTNPGSVIGLDYPLCEKGRLIIANGCENFRYRQNNILQMDFDFIPSRIEDFQNEISPEILQVIGVALNYNQQQQRIVAKEKIPNIYIDDVQQMNKQQVMRQRQNINREKSAKKIRPVPNKNKK